MSDQSLATEIPHELWGTIGEVEYDGRDMEATGEVLRKVRTRPVTLELGVAGVTLATKIRLYDFGEMTDGRGTLLNEKKEHPYWLGAETLNIMAVQAADQQ